MTAYRGRSRHSVTPLDSDNTNGIGDPNDNHEELAMWDRVRTMLERILDMASKSDALSEEVSIFQDTSSQDANLEATKARLEKLLELSSQESEGFHKIRSTIDRTLEHLSILIALRSAVAEPTTKVRKRRADTMEDRSRAATQELISNTPAIPVPTATRSSARSSPVPPPTTTTTASSSSSSSSALNSHHQVTGKTLPGGVQPQNIKKTRGRAASSAAAVATTSSSANGNGVVVGGLVALRLKKQKGMEGEWIQCVVIKIHPEHAKHRYEVQDPEPDDNNNPGQIYKANPRDIIPIPPESIGLSTLAPGTRVLARYPETTTFYPAEVLGTKRDGTLRLKFEGEEEEDKETEVERRLVLETS